MRARMAVLGLVAAGMAMTATAQAQAVTMALEGVAVDDGNWVDRPNWIAPPEGGSASWNQPADSSTYTWAMPATIGPDGADVTLSVTAEARPNSSGNRTVWAPSMGISGALVESTSVSAYAESDGQASDAKSVTVKLRPTTGTAVVSVGLQDGPTYRYTYEAVRGGGCATPRFAFFLQAPVVCPPTIVPAIGATTTYAAPEPGDETIVRFPRPGRVTTALSGDLRFVDAAGNPQIGPSLIGIAANLGKARELCEILVAEDASTTDGGQSDLERLIRTARGIRCLQVVSQILARADELRRAREGQPPVRALTAQARRACMTAIAGQRKARRGALRVTCVGTTGGLRLSIAPRARGKTLRDVIGRTPPRLIVARSALDDGAPGDLMRARWSAKRR